MIEILQKSLKQPEPNADLFHFLEDSFLHLDAGDESVVANYPLFLRSTFPVFMDFVLAIPILKRIIYSICRKENSFTIIHRINIF